MIKVDLHIHSVLSPCCERENTVCNIVNMSQVLGNRVIALADHNCGGNVAALTQTAKQNGIVVLPAMEVTTAEEIHCLCYFTSVSQCERFSDELSRSMPKYALDKQIFYPQLLLDANDNQRGEVDYLLNVATNYDIYSLCDRVASYGGVAVPAHVDKPSNSLVSQLGCVPFDLPIKAVEVSSHCDSVLLEQLSSRYTILRSSDAHSLEQMCESDFSLDIKDATIEAVMELLK